MTADKYLGTLRQIQALVNEALAEERTKRPTGKRVLRGHPPATIQLSFTMNILAFMKRYATGRSGPEKFTLVVAYLAKGSTDAQVEFLDIRGSWNKMKTVLGSFNPAHGNRAKANGWVEPVKTGTWKLTSSWKEALA